MAESCLDHFGVEIRCDEHGRKEVPQLVVARALRQAVRQIGTGLRALTSGMRLAGGFPQRRASATALRQQ
jgi:hypothetical protein